MLLILRHGKPNTLECCAFPDLGSPNQWSGDYFHAWVDKTIVARLNNIGVLLMFKPGRQETIGVLLVFRQAATRHWSVAHFQIWEARNHCSVNHVQAWEDKNHCSVARLQTWEAKHIGVLLVFTDGRTHTIVALLIYTKTLVLLAYRNSFEACLTTGWLWDGLG